MKATDGKSCPGEAVCTSDREKGEVAGIHGRLQGYTLQNHCHNGCDKEGNPLDALSGYMEPCQLYETKLENVPENLIGAITAAEEFKEYKALGLLAPDLTKITAFEYTCYSTAEAAASTIEAEEIAEIQKKSNQTGTAEPDKIGGTTAVHSDPMNW